MKKIFLLLIVTFLFNNVLFSQQYVMNSQGYTISGQVKKGSGYVTLRTYLRDGNEVLDSVTMDKKGRFVFRGYSPQIVPALLTINNKRSYRIYLEPKLNMEITLDTKKTFPKIQNAPQTERWYSIVKPIGKEDADVYFERLENWTLTNPEDVFSPDIMAMYLSHNWSYEQLQNNLNTLKGQATQVYHYKHLRNREQSISHLANGKKSPEINLQSVDGKNLSLQSLTRKNKYILIDFWATWCEDCRTNNLQLSAIYNKYKDKGFDIYSISLDDNKQQLVKVIQEDNIVWNVVCDYKKWNSKPVKDYDVKAIGYNILIDNNGNIIDKNINIENLNNKLNDLLIEKGFTINGNINGITEGNVKLDLLLEGGKKQSFTTRINNGNFSFKGKVEKTCMAMLTFPIKDGVISFFMDNDDIFVSGNKKNLENVSIKGSAKQDIFKNIASNCNNQSNPMQCLMNYVKNNPTSIYSPFIISNYLYPYMNEEDRLLAIKTLDGEAKTMFQYTLLTTQANEIAEKTDILTNKVKDFTLTNLEGYDVSLYNYIRNNQYTLITFWASWDNMSRKKNLDYLKLYNVYHKNGFNIISVSLDDNTYSWQKASQEDGINKWENVSDLKRWNSSIVRLYGLTSIPYNILVDKNGNILAQNITTEQIINIITNKQ